MVLYLGFEHIPFRHCLPGRAIRVAIPVIFGISLLVIWEGTVRAFNVPGVILPPPSIIGITFVNSLDILWIDLVQTVFKGALSGYVIGCGSAIIVAIAVNRYPFLQRGILPLGNFVAALPIVGTAPIFVMWFGFGWQSKAAVVVAMVFFPMLVNMVQGLASTDVMQRDILKTYNATYWQEIWKLKLPAAMPFAFNGLKICYNIVSDWGYCCRVLWIPHSWNGLQNIHRSRAVGP